jgi:hypothetical protein
MANPHNNLSGVDRKVFLAMVDSGRLSFTTKELVADLLGEPPLNNNLRKLSITPTHIPDWAGSAPTFAGGSRFSGLLTAFCYDDVAIEKKRWHRLIDAMTDSEWESLWAKSGHRHAIACACAEWASPRD